MRNARRILALGAMTLTAGAVLGMSATAASAATTQAAQPSAAQPGPHHNGGGDHDKGDRRNNGHVRTYVAGRYNSKKTCQFFAWVGEAKGRFDHGYCAPAKGHGWLLIAQDYGHKRHR
ncbi:hypothetical protein [Dactylosporangium sp. CA-092794]|uniref:hypothetical protein n=1 Tax=Dactylosporangium sp. CA-092794 TaxID=3239929 RepID=UPI003D8E3485